MLNGKNLQIRVLGPARLALRIEGEIEFPRETKTKGVNDYSTMSARNIDRDTLNGMDIPKVTV